MVTMMLLFRRLNRQDHITAAIPACNSRLEKKKDDCEYPG